MSLSLFLLMLFWGPCKLPKPTRSPGSWPVPLEREKVQSGWANESQIGFPGLRVKASFMTEPMHR